MEKGRSDGKIAPTRAGRNDALARSLRLPLKDIITATGVKSQPNGDYQAVRLTVSTVADANFVIDEEGNKIALQVPEDKASFEWPLKFEVVDGQPTNLVIDFLVNPSIEEGENGALLLVPDCHGDEEDDRSAEDAIGGIVGQVTPATAGEVVAVRTDGSAEEADEKDGEIDPKTGTFRVGGLAPGIYELHVKIEGWAELVVPGIVVAAGQDTTLAQAITLVSPGASGS
jgi:hypothetical protein